MGKILLKTFLVLLLGSCSGALSAQKALRAVRLSLKNNKPAEALTQIAKLERDSAVRLLPDLYACGVEAYVQLYDAANEKFYLRQKSDTAAFFGTVRGVYVYALRCDSVEQLQLAAHGGKAKRRKAMGDIVRRYYSNLTAGGRYFYGKRRYADALPLLALAVDVPQTDVWGADKSVADTRAYLESGGLLFRSACQLKNYPEALRRAPLALRDTGRVRQSVLEALADIYVQTADSTRWLATMERGMREFPAHAPFFTAVSDYRTRHGRYADVLALADSMLVTDSLNVFFRTARCQALLNLGRNEEAARCASGIVALDSTAVDAYYYAGAAYCNLAAEVELPTSINSKAARQARERQCGFYAEARPFLEAYRRLKPDGKDLWAPLLYRVYLALNDGKAFGEMQRLMGEL